MVCLYTILYVSGVYTKVMPQLNSIYLVGCLGLALVLTFIFYPARRGDQSGRLRWYDFLFILASLISCGYLFFFQKDTTQMWLTGEVPLFVQILFIILCICVLEGCRRTLGWSMSIVAIISMLIAVFGRNLPGILHNIGYSLRDLTINMYMGPIGIFGIVLDVYAVVIIMYMIFSQFLLLTGAGEFFINICLSLLGRVRGGPAKAAVASSALMGTISGQSVVNAVTIGGFTIPLMKAYGYKPEVAGAIEAVASNGGIIMPPVMGVFAFVMSSIIGVPYNVIVIAAAIPAILYYGSLLIQVDLEAAKMGLRGLPQSEIPSIKKTLREGFFYFLPIIILAVLLIGVMLEPQQAALYSILSIIPLSFLAKKEGWMTPKNIVNALKSTARLLPIIAMPCAVAGLIQGSMNMSGLPLALTAVLTNLVGQDPLVLLILSAVIIYGLGTGVDALVNYIVVAALIAPTLVQSGIPLISVHLFLIYFAITDFITPPVCVTAFTTAAMAGAKPMQTGLQAMRLGIATYFVPFLFTLMPALCLKGAGLGEILIAISLSIPSIAALAAAAAGFILTKLNWLQRALLAMGGVLIALSRGKTITFMIIGLGLICVVILWQIVTVRARKIS
jgi:TRAP transporter 4TM/12TM fusion protein